MEQKNGDGALSAFAVFMSSAEYTMKWVLREVEKIATFAPVMINKPEI